MWAYGHGSTFSCLQVGRRKKGILNKFPATVTHRQCCNFVISIIVAHDADVSLCVHVFLSYQFYCHLIAHVLLENSSLCTFAICCHTNWLAFSPKIIALRKWRRPTCSHGRRFVGNSTHWLQIETASCAKVSARISCSACLLMQMLQNL